MHDDYAELRADVAYLHRGLEDEVEAHKECIKGGGTETWVIGAYVEGYKDYSKGEPQKYCKM